MTFFVDFDRTIFDFDSFISILLDEPGLAPLRERLVEVVQIPRGFSPEHDQKRNTLWEEVHRLYVSGAFSFPERSLARFVYPDAREFLEGRGKGAVIVTKGGFQLAFQKGKVEASGIMHLVSHCEYVLRDTPKGESIKKILPNYPAPYVFIDDFPTELKSVEALCPEVSLYEIRRDGKPGSGIFPVVHSFADIP